jgi:hypothetical protein
VNDLVAALALDDVPRMPIIVLLRSVSGVSRLDKPTGEPAG